MTLLPDITELLLLPVFDRGVPNTERIVIKPQLALDIGNYGVLVGLRMPGQDLVTPLRDQLFWFGTGMVYPTDWLFLYTGHGTPSRIPYESGHVMTVYWGRNETVFHDHQFVPAVVRFGSILVEQRPRPVPQPAAGLLAQAALENPLIK